MASSVGHEEKSLVVGETSVDKLPQEALYRLVVLGGGFFEAERDFPPTCGHPQSNHHLLACHVFGVDDQGCEVQIPNRSRMVGGAASVLSETVGLFK